MNISKAFDSVNKECVILMLKKMGFKGNFIGWIQSCISSFSLATLVNGVSSLLFGSTRGLRQGDPLSPILFVIVMEGLTSLLEYSEAQGKIKALGKNECAINHLFFANDVMIFSKASEYWVKQVKGVLLSFSNTSGLQMNLEKAKSFLVRASRPMSCTLPTSKKDHCP